MLPLGLNSAYDSGKLGEVSGLYEKSRSDFYLQASWRGTSSPRGELLVAFSSEEPHQIGLPEETHPLDAEDREPRSRAAPVVGEQEVSAFQLCPREGPDFLQRARHGSPKEL